MTPNDDILGVTPQGQTGKHPGTVGPESEVRGGPEAPGDAPGPDVSTSPEMAPTPNRRPGSRAALPAGSLPGPYLGPQGDENRDPPAGAPSPTRATETVEDISKSADRRGNP